MFLFCMLYSKAIVLHSMDANCLTILNYTYQKTINPLYVAWRKCVKRIVRLSMKIHSCLLYSVCEDDGIEVQLHMWFIKLFNIVWMYMLYLVTKQRDKSHSKTMLYHKQQQINMLESWLAVVLLLSQTLLKVPAKICMLKLIS